MGGKGGTLGALDALELVDGVFPEAVTGPADPLSEEVVKVGHIFVSFGDCEDYDKSPPDAKGQPGMEEEGVEGGLGADDGGAA
jgi:hypothetical protein